jgi:hypothetical protein
MNFGEKTIFAEEIVEYFTFQKMLGPVPQGRGYSANYCI